MTDRLSASDLYRLCPQIPEALSLLASSEQPTEHIEGSLGHLIRLRISQINHCCYCQRMHAEDAREDGERQVRLDVLPAWREAACFSSRERTALMWAEALTRASEGGVPDDFYHAAIDESGSSGLLALTAIVLEINSWNRVSLSLGFQPDF